MYKLFYIIPSSAPIHWWHIYTWTAHCQLWGNCIPSTAAVNCSFLVHWSNWKLGLTNFFTVIMSLSFFTLIVSLVFRVPIPTCTGIKYLESFYWSMGYNNPTYINEIFEAPFHNQVPVPVVCFRFAFAATAPTAVTGVIIRRVNFWRLGNGTIIIPCRFVSLHVCYRPTVPAI